MRARTGVIAVAVAMFLAVATFATAQSKQGINKKAPEPGNKPIETYTAFARSISTGGAASITIVINRWSTEDERQLLLNVLKTSGSQAAVNVMQDMPQVGYIKGSQTMGDALFFARQTTLPDGTRRVVLATNRPLSAAAMLNPGAANKYDALVIEMHFPKGKDKGEGKIVVGGKAEIDPKTGQVHIQNYQGQPVVLSDIRMKTP
jgi:hypothetical protein